MTPHIRDKELLNAQTTQPTDKKYRLFGIDGEGKPYFYWSATPGKYAACYGRDKKWWVWGTLTCGSGKANIKAENRIFISDYEMALALESALGFRPCKNCDKTGEFERWTRANGK
jgi:hypothetical protein